MTRSARIPLGDKLEAARLVQRYTADISFQEFQEDIEKQDAVVRRIEIIGEAIKKLPSQLRQDHPDVPRRDITGARDIVTMNISGSISSWRGRWFRRTFPNSSPRSSKFWKKSTSRTATSYNKPVCGAPRFARLALRGMAFGHAADR